MPTLKGRGAIRRQEGVTLGKKLDKAVLRAKGRFKKEVANSVIFYQEVEKNEWKMALAIEMIIIMKSIQENELEMPFSVARDWFTAHIKAMLTWCVCFHS